MIDIRLANSSVVKGDRLLVRISHPQVFKYNQLQIEVFDTGVTNPSSKLGLGTTPTRLNDDSAQVEIDSTLLPLGIYEIYYVLFHTPIDQNQPSRLDFVRINDYSRVVFEVVESLEGAHAKTTLLNEIQHREQEIERSFLTPIDIRETDCCDASVYRVFVFVRDVLIGTHIRFSHFELVPSSNGLDSKDLHDFVNWFLHQRTMTRLQFDYEDGFAAHSRQSNPVFIVHFPAIKSSSFEEAKNHCIEEVNNLLLALSLTRDAGGMIFDVVVQDHQMESGKKFSMLSSYTGNQLVGDLAGESAERLQTYCNGLLRDQVNQFLVGLFREAKRERNPNLQYIRFWQILEIMAESNNYNPNDPLLDYEGNVMMNEGKPMLSKSSVNIVFRLLRDWGTGNTRKTWENVNIWFAFRSAVAHYGSISKHSDLSRENLRNLARNAYDEITQSNYDRFLWELKEDTKLLLMKRLVKSATNMQ